MTKATKAEQAAASFEYDVQATKSGYYVKPLSQTDKMQVSQIVGFCRAEGRIKPFSFELELSWFQSLSYDKIAEIVMGRSFDGGIEVLSAGELPKGWGCSFGFENLGFNIYLSSPSGHVGLVRAAVGGYRARHIYAGSREGVRLRTVHGAIAKVVDLHHQHLRAELSAQRATAARLVG